MNLTLQYKAVGYAQTGKDAVIAPAADQIIHLYSARAYNGSGGAITVGIVRKIALAQFDVYSWIQGDKAYLVNAAKTTATNFFNADNDGLVLQSDEKFGHVRLGISTAQAGGVYTIEYWNGSAFASVVGYVTIADMNSTERHLVFPAPIDWVAGSNLTGTSSSKYTIFIKGTTQPPGGDVGINAVQVGELLTCQGAVADKTFIELPTFFAKQPLLVPGIGIYPYFGGTATNKNVLQAIYAIQD